MKSFLETINSNLSVGQKHLLSRFLEDVRSGRLPGDVEALRVLLEGTGSLLAQPSLDIEQPESYNLALQVLLSNLAGLYQELDQLESIHNQLADLNTVELDRVEGALRDLGAVVSSTERANQDNLQWTDAFFETFGGNTPTETDPIWYQPLPLATGTSGQVEAFLPAYIDLVDRSLKLRPGGDFSRTVNLDGQPLAQVSLDELLGLSVDPLHGPTLAVDGRFDTYWRELILSEGPINADVLQVPWLPENYDGGAAARLHFRYPAAVPFSEIQIRPFARYPLQILQVVWDNRKKTISNKVVNSSFSVSLSGWTSTVASGNTINQQTSGGYSNGTNALFTHNNDGRSTLVTSGFAVTSNQTPYHFRLKAYRAEEMKVQGIVQWTTSGGVILRSDWVDLDGPDEEWFETSNLLLSPSTAASGQLSLVVDGTGTTRITDVVFSQAHGQRTHKVAAELDSDVLSMGINNAVGTDLWVVLVQPHYDLVHMSIPEGDLTAQNVWDQFQLEAASEAEKIYRFSSTAWTLEGGRIENRPSDLPNLDNVLVSEARRLGGRVWDLVTQLLSYVHPSQKPRKLNRYMYILGAWEIQIRHREYAPQGLFVSKPYRPRGECRDLVMITNPGLDDEEIRGKLRFWLVPRDSDGPDQAQPFYGRATFSAVGEQQYYTEQTHFQLPPIARRDTFKGTDRRNQVPLPYHPYLNRAEVVRVNQSISSGTLTSPLSYDGNRVTYYVELSGGTTTTVTGYQPLKVWLYFQNGEVARPDVLGRVQVGDIGFVSEEILIRTNAEEVTEKENPKGRKRKRTVEAIYQTLFHPIVTGNKGAAIALYWHKSQDMDRTSGTTYGNPITSGDVLINKAEYRVDAAAGLITVKAKPPKPVYDTIIAYYYYRRTDEEARYIRDDRTSGSVPTSGIDTDGPNGQQYPVTRNMTDYIYGTVPKLRRAVLDELDPDYYPVYEYYVDERGFLVFANNLHQVSDTPAEVVAEYESLQISPRLLIEFIKRGSAALSTRTPALMDYALLLNCRK
jgi:hypothetical protein